MLLLLWLLGASTSSATPGQKRSTTNYGATVTVHEYDEVPEATEPCTAEECAWWIRLRTAANELQKSGEEKSKRKFAVLFAEGLEKSYRVPLKDRAPHVLALGRAIYPPTTISRLRERHVNGRTEVSVEFRADGSIGEVRLIKGLDAEFDKIIIQAARQNLFLPAVKDGKFVTEWQTGGTGFSTHR
jgi:hypothetical protein